MRFATSLSVACLFVLVAAPGASARAKGRGRDAATRLVEGLASDCRKAAALWRRACPGRSVQGLCAARRAGVTASGLPTALAPRRPAQAKAALDLYASIVRRWDKGRLQRAVPEEHPRREALLIRMRECVAEAVFVTHEKTFETFLGSEPPRDLDMAPANPQRAKADMRRFSEWLKGTLLQGGALIQEYMKVITSVRVPVDGKPRSSGPYSLAVVLRSGQIFHHFADDIGSVPTPANLRQDPDAVHAYETEMMKFIAPLLEKARARYQMCVKLVTDLKMAGSDPWAKACRAALKSLPAQAKP